MIEPFPTTAEVNEVLKSLQSASLPDTDDLVELADRFVHLKRSLGYRYQAPAQRLQAFLRFLHQRGVRKASELSMRAMLDWHASRQGVQKLTRIGDLNAVSVFMDHLKAIGKVQNNLCGFLKERFTRNYRPYTFTPDELRNIFSPHEETTEAHRLRAFIYFVIYACALRAGEAQRLKMRHFDPEKGTLFIEKSKWNKDRLLPLHDRVVCRLRRYVALRRRDADAEAPLFVDIRGRGYKNRELTNWFRYDLQTLGLYRPTRQVDGIRHLSTRAHGLRHTFAVNRLLKWYREGADVLAMLPFLTTYMGHSDVYHTQVYLTVTGLILREANERFAGHWEKQYPLRP